MGVDDILQYLKENGEYSGRREIPHNCCENCSVNTTGGHMNIDFKSVSIYVTTNDDLFILPRGVSKKWGGAVIDLELH